MDKKNSIFQMNGITRVVIEERQEKEAKAVKMRRILFKSIYRQRFGKRQENE